MASVAVVGARGYVGSALVEALKRRADHSVFEVTRENYRTMQTSDFDILINCAMPSGRFFAKNNPEKDFTETVEKTARLLYEWKYRKFVQVSTISARSQLDTVYGRHKAAAEKLCDDGNNLIARLGSMYSPGLSKGVLVDMKEGKTVFVDGKSRYCFAPLAFVTEWIATHLDRSGIVEVGARNAIALHDIAKHIGGDIVFEGALDNQEVVDPEPNFPDANDVLTFLDNWENKSKIVV